MSEAPHSLSPLSTSGERAGERGTFPWTGGRFVKPLSLSLSPLLRRGARGSTTGVVEDAPALLPIGIVLLTQVFGCTTIAAKPSVPVLAVLSRWSPEGQIHLCVAC